MQRGKCGKNLRWTLDDYGTLTIKGYGAMDDYSNEKKPPWHNKRCIFQSSIDKVIIEYGATSIGDEAFNWCKNLTEIEIPDSVTSIGKGAFEWCTNLTEIEIPNSVTSIGISGFCGCNSLTEIEISDSVTKIEKFIFWGCESLTEIEIPDGVTEIGAYAFYKCSNLSNITFPDSVITIDDEAFAGCLDLNEIKIPDFVTTIGDYAFAACLNLEELTIPFTVMKLGENVFGGCASLKKIFYHAYSGFDKKLSAGNSAELIPYKGFDWHFDGKTLTVGGVREIENFPYAKIPWVDHLRDIQRIIIGNGVEKISAHAFDECTRLELLTLPASVKTIGDMAFSVCFCGSVHNNKNVFWCLEDGVLVLKKNPDAPPAADFSTGSVSWIFAEKNIRSVKLEDGVKPTVKFFEWMTRQFNGKEISFK